MLLLLYRVFRVWVKINMIYIGIRTFYSVGNYLINAFREDFPTKGKLFQCGVAYSPVLMGSEIVENLLLTSQQSLSDVWIGLFSRYKGLSNQVKIFVSSNFEYFFLTDSHRGQSKKKCFSSSAIFCDENVIYFL